MSDTGTSPSSELWLLDTDSWLLDAPCARGGLWGLVGLEEGGVEGKWWGELWVEDCWDAGQMGVNADPGGRVEVFGSGESNLDCAAEKDREEEWAAVGEVRGLVEGRMEEESVAEDWLADWAAEGEDMKEVGRVAEECEEAGGTARSGERWLGEVFSVSCVSSVLCGILLLKARVKLFVETRQMFLYYTSGFTDMKRNIQVMMKCHAQRKSGSKYWNKRWIPTKYSIL